MIISIVNTSTFFLNIFSSLHRIKNTDLSIHLYIHTSVSIYGIFGLVKNKNNTWLYDIICLLFYSIIFRQLYKSAGEFRCKTLYIRFGFNGIYSKNRALPFKTSGHDYNIMTYEPNVFATIWKYRIPFLIIYHIIYIIIYIYIILYRRKTPSKFIILFYGPECRISLDSFVKTI